MLLGAIARAHGVQGEVQLLPFNPDSPWWQGGTELFIVDPQAYGLTRQDDFLDVEADVLPEIVRLDSVRPGPKGRLVGRLSASRNRGAADALRGCLLAAPAEVLGQLDEGEFWYHELVGWDVDDVAGAGVVGQVVRIVPAHTDLLEVRPAVSGPTFFIPMVDAFIRELDREGRRVVVELIEGLLP